MYPFFSDEKICEPDQFSLGSFNVGQTTSGSKTCVGALVGHDLGLGNTWLFTTAGKIGRWMLPKLPRFMVYNRLNAWGKQRELPPMPKQSFRELYRKMKSK